MTYYGQGLNDIGNGLKDIARAIVRAAEIKGSLNTYNIVVTGEATPETVAKAVKEALAVNNAKSDRV